MEKQKFSVKPLVWVIAGLFLMVALVSVPAETVAKAAPTNPDPTHVVSDGSGGWELTPVSGDNWANLRFALNNTQPEGKVKLSAGTFTIRRNVFVANFQGTLEGAGMDETLIRAEVEDANGNLVYTQSTQAEVDNLFLPHKDAIMSGRAVKPLVFTESDSDVDGNPTQARSTKVTSATQVLGQVILVFLY